ncbi:hypothetical protein [Methanolobus profundi]|nr:hypothetical protein [Methanolobus profundi]
MRVQKKKKLYWNHGGPLSILLYFPDSARCTMANKEEVPTIL